MKISTQTEVIASGMGDEAAIRMLAETGFECYDFSMFSISEKSHPLSGKQYTEYAKQLRKTADICGIQCNQSHAPFPSIMPGNEQYNHAMFPLLARSIEVTAILGGSITVVHPVSLGTYELETNLEFYRSLLPYAREFNVKIALENMWTWPDGSPTAQPGACATPERFIALLDALDRRYFTACLDIGHAEMAGTGSNAVELIHALGPRLGALHVHDNDLLHDNHTMPYAGRIQWRPVMAALHDIGYEGDYTLEADSFLERFPEELKPQALRMMKETARWMADNI